MTDRSNWRKRLIRLGLWDQYQTELKEMRAAGKTREEADQILIPKFELCEAGSPGANSSDPCRPYTASGPGGIGVPVSGNAVPHGGYGSNPSAADFDVDLRRDLKWVYANLARKPDFSKAPSQGCEAMWNWANENPAGFIKELLRQEPARELNDRAGDERAIDDLLRSLIKAELDAIAPDHGRADDGVLPSRAQGTEGERGVSPESEDEGAT